VSSFSPSDGQQSDGHVLLTLGPLDPHACACRVGQYPAGLTGYNLRTTPSHTGIQGHGQDRRTLLRTLFTSVTCTNRTDVETLHPSFRVRLPTSDRTHRFGLIISLGFERIPHVHGAHAQWQASHVSSHIQDVPHCFTSSCMMAGASTILSERMKPAMPSMNGSQSPRSMSDDSVHESEVRSRSRSCVPSIVAVAYSFRPRERLPESTATVQPSTSV
jgi:hypothetical protein